jgi:hypothetical protein
VTLSSIIQSLFSDILSAVLAREKLLKNAKEYVYECVKF